MTLRGKLISFLACSVLVCVLIAAFIIEATYLASSDYASDGKSPILDPYFWEILGIIAITCIVCAVSFYWASSHLIITPMRTMADVAENRRNGAIALMRTISRNDEVGRIAAVFNRLIGETTDLRNQMQHKVDEALAETEKSQSERALTERLAATGRMAARITSNFAPCLKKLNESLASLEKPGALAAERESCLRQCRDTLMQMNLSLPGVFDMAKARPSPAPTSVASALRHSIGVVEEIANHCRVRLDLEINDSGAIRGEGLTTVADADDLKHVFLNIIMNAIDAMPRGGVLTIRASRILKWVIIEIIDTGVGLTLDELSSSFEFYHSSKTGGLEVGLGLSVARAIVADYGGALTLNSRKGEGTKATVELPAIDIPIRHDTASLAAASS